MRRVLVAGRSSPAPPTIAAEDRNSCEQRPGVLVRRAFEDLVVPEETGFLVPPEDIKQLIEATDKMMGDAALRQSMADASRRKVVEQHQIEHEADALIAIYQRLIGEA